MGKAVGKLNEGATRLFASELIQFFGLIGIREMHKKRSTRRPLRSTRSVWTADLANQIFPRALNTRSGVNGNSSTQTPVASWIAAPMAGATGNKGSSPSPRAPQGSFGSGTSTNTVSTFSG